MLSILRSNPRAFLSERITCLSTIQNKHMERFILNMWVKNLKYRITVHVK